MKPSEVSRFLFTKEQVETLDYHAWVDRFDPSKAPPAELRRQVGSTVLGFESFALDPIASCGDPGTRTFVQRLHGQWPHAFYYLSLSGDYFRGYIFCLLSNTVVQRRPGSRATVTGYNNDELFQLIGHGILEMEKTCTQAGMGPSDYRNRSRLLLKHFGFI